MTRLHCVLCDAYLDSTERHVCPVRYTKVGNHYVIRPQAERPPETWGEAFRRNWPEWLGGMFTLLALWFAIAWWLPLLAVQP